MKILQARQHVLLCLQVLQQTWSCGGRRRKLTLCEHVQLDGAGFQSNGATCIGLIKCSGCALSQHVEVALMFVAQVSVTNDLIFLG